MGCGEMSGVRCSCCLVASAVLSLNTSDDDAAAVATAVAIPMAGVAVAAAADDDDVDDDNNDDDDVDVEALPPTEEEREGGDALHAVAIAPPRLQAPTDGYGEEDCFKKKGALTTHPNRALLTPAPTP